MHRAVASSEEAHLYNLSRCPPKKRFRTTTLLLPAKKRIQAFQHEDPELRLLLEPEDDTCHKSRASRCHFCRGTGDSEEAGMLMEHRNGRLLQRHSECSSAAVLVHWRCAEWSPNVYFDGEDQAVCNLKSEIARARKLKCYACGVKGAALGCFFKRCRKTFHYSCARGIEECRWDTDNYLLLCPDHASCNFPGEK